MNSYPLSFWYVEDPAEPQEAPVLRFSRRGWMEGMAVLDGVEARVLLTEDEMDGIFDKRDSWALASADSAGDVLKAQYARDAGTHAWLFDRAYEIREMDPSGRRMVIAPFDPGITRAEEEEMHDDLKVDREAPRSGRVVAFVRDFEDARNRARKEGMRLLVDFETTWCGPCKLMDEWVYTADPVVDAAAEVIAVKVDGDERPELKKQFSVEGFPTIVLLSPAGEEIRRISGYVNVADMVAFLSGT
jgi:thiol-disulfide isomerase/thioredoxin